MEKVYMMQKRNRRTYQNIVVGARDTLRTLVTYKPRIPMLVIIIISQIRLGGLSAFADQS